jgi:hypothetical protein
VLTADIDVRPGSPNNNIQPNSGGVVSVAILSSSDLDAATVDPATLRFGPNQTGVKSVRRLRDVNGDKLRDLVVQFRISESGVRCGDSTVSVSGQTVQGTFFEGSDSIGTVGCKPKNPKKK